MQNYKSYEGLSVEGTMMKMDYRIEKGRYYSNYFTPSDFARHCLLYRISSGHFFTDCQWTVERKRYDSYLLMYQISGQMECRVQEMEYTLQAGEAILMNCYEPHRYKTTMESELYWMHYDGNGAARLFSGLAAHGSACVFRGEEATKVRKFLVSSWEETENNSLKETEVSARIDCLLTGIMPSCNEEAKSYKYSSDLVNCVDSFIQANFENTIMLRDIARHIAISESQLIKEYKCMTGITPYAALVKYRMSVACELLCRTNLSISSIAEKCGYQSLSNFTYSFNLEFGISPTKYRSSHTSSDSKEKML